MKQPIIRLHQDVYDKLDNLAHEYHQATGGKYFIFKAHRQAFTVCRCA